MSACWATPDAPVQRSHPEPVAAGEYPFAVDRDRILRCSAFRRLDFKTQVFVPHEHDHFRTRLTHTLEVAQVARNLCRALGLNEDLAEAVSLAHDLGHPPFGHVGEAVLDGLMRSAGTEGFEHNRQSLRIVDYLEHPFPEFRGLNLTQPTRCCLARHETRYDLPVCTDLPETPQPPLEGQIVDLADELAYTTADLEDALVAGWLDEARLAGERIWQRAWAAAEARYPRARAIHTRIRANAAVLELLCEDLLETTSRNLREAGAKSAQDVQHHPTRLARLSAETLRDLRSLQDLLFQRVYKHPAIVEKDTLAEQMLRDLFARYVEKPGLMDPRYARRVETPPADDPAGGGLHRVVCDYIAGMTDRYCRAEHQKLFDSLSRGG